MKLISAVISLLNLLIFQNTVYCQDIIKSVTVPFILDHNRMIVEAEIQSTDGNWRKVRLWVDSGSPQFFIGESLARDLGIDLSAAEDSSFNGARLQITDLPTIRIGGKELNFDRVESNVMFQPFWLFSTMHTDGNLPATVLKKYHIVFDYPELQLTIAEPGSIKPHGVSSKAKIHAQTGIVRLEAIIGGDSLGLALDNGASFSFISEHKLNMFSGLHPAWPEITGTAGCANMWGWWPADEQRFKILRIPQIQWGEVKLNNLGIAGVPAFSQSGPTLGEWYSRKTADKVEGFLGANALKNFRVEIDYNNSMVYFEQNAEKDPRDLDLVGISIRQLADGSYQVLGIVLKDGKPVVDGIEAGDILISIDNFITQGETMGKVIDALRGKPGDNHILKINRNGKEIKIETTVRHLL